MAPAVTLLKALLGQLMPLLRPWQAQRGPRSTLSRPRPVDQRIPIRLAHNRQYVRPGSGVCGLIWQCWIRASDVYLERCR
jgi:hypothetical protein